VITDNPEAEEVLEAMAGEVELLPWEAGLDGNSVDGIYTYAHPRVDGELLDRLLPRVKVVSNYGVGVDHIRVADAAARGIPVGNTPGVVDGATADLGMALMLAAARRLVECDRHARSEKFDVVGPAFLFGNDVHEKTLGIIGLGNVGRAVARRALAFDMSVLYYNRRRRPDIESEMGVEYAPFDELLGRSDYIMLCCPLTADTRHMIGRDQFRKMKPSATLVNMARGGVVHTDALHEALRDGTIARAAVDVTEPEPLPRDHPLHTLDNLTIVPHMGTATYETRRKMAELSVKNLWAGLRGEPLLHEVRP
jgi:glyoxylate reductase